MGKALYAMWLVAATAMHLFGNNVGTFAILAASFAVPLLSGLVLLFFARKFNGQLKFTLPSTAAKGAEIAGALLMPRSFLQISGTLVCENTFTGEKETQPFVGTGFTFEIQADKCGAIKIEARDIFLEDPLGFFKKRANTIATHTMIIPPTGYTVAIPITDTATSLDSDEYSANKAGMDVSETYAIREYAPGDPIRSIHWKLSEKLDKTMVREFGLPIGNSVLLVLTPTGGIITPQGWDATAELFYSIQLALVKKGIRTTTTWPAESTVSHNLTNEEDAEIAMADCLATYCKNQPHKPMQPSHEQIMYVTPAEVPFVSQ